MSYALCRSRAALPRCGCSPARQLFERFHRLRPDRLLRMSCRRVVPPVLVQLGTLRGLIYSAQKDRGGRPKTYIHFMERPPLLTCDPGGRQLYILGGRYRVTRRGIEG